MEPLVVIKYVQPLATLLACRFGTHWYRLRTIQIMLIYNLCIYRGAVFNSNHLCICRGIAIEGDAVSQIIMPGAISGVTQTHSNYVNLALR